MPDWLIATLGFLARVAGREIADAWKEKKQRERAEKAAARRRAKEAVERVNRDRVARLRAREALQARRLDNNPYE